MSSVPGSGMEDRVKKWGEGRCGEREGSQNNNLDRPSTINAHVHYLPSPSNSKLCFNPRLLHTIRHTHHSQQPNQTSTPRTPRNHIIKAPFILLFPKICDHQPTLNLSSRSHTAVKIFAITPRSYQIPKPPIINPINSICTAQIFMSKVRPHHTFSRRCRLATVTASLVYTYLAMA